MFPLEGAMAEWSKAPDLGSGPEGRGFEPHSHHFAVFSKIQNIFFVVFDFEPFTTPLFYTKNCF